MKKLAFLAIILALAIWVWPTRYKYYDAGTGPHSEQVGHQQTRVDRISGDVWAMQTTGEWVPVHIQRPELLRPDVTGSTRRTQTNTGNATQQNQSVQDMQSTADEMSDAAVEAARE